MKIILTSEVAVKLLSYALFTKGMEFSGVGFVDITPAKNFEVYDFIIMDIGSETYTEIDPNKLMKLSSRPDAKKMKVWIHRHPVGNGIKGRHNWSSTDENTCVNEPFGMIPEMIGWSLAVVITPSGWVGRYDDHIQNKTVHLEVEPPIRPFLADIQHVQETGVSQSREGIEEILEQLEEAISNFDSFLLDDLRMDEGILWDLLAAKIDWKGFVPVSYTEWVTMRNILTPDQASSKLFNDWRDFAYGSGSSMGIK